LLTTNINTEYVYWADNGNIFSSFKKLSAWVIILIPHYYSKSFLL
jgi:hypothetical protein